MKIRNELITSRNNPFVKWGCSLTDTKGRQQARSFICEGEKLSFEALESELPVTHVLLMESKSEKMLPRVKLLLDKDAFLSTEVVILSDAAFEKVSTEKAPQGIICIIKYLDNFKVCDIIYKEEFFSSPDERAIILSSVRDPGNLGSVIRSAVAFGVDHIILTDDCADIYNPKTIRSAMGSLFRVKISTVKNMVDSIPLIRQSGRRVFAAELSDSARSISDVGLLKSDIVMIGNEGHGISKELSDVCDMSVYIPISKKTESLNASVAAAIFMWEQDK